MAKPKPSSPSRGQRELRCAIYTRKSSEEGLEQDFNSLDAQREACEAYIASQKSEGWRALIELYDDGGFSGGTTDRPALQRLLADVAGGKIDCVMVYKVDRLTRSLSDFVKMVEIFDKQQVSFVSITQAFNTTTSMGRLTLNVLLSFAQFEREVTGERIRDKIAASKKKGMWMGGHAPLGYDAKDRKLVINEAEAETVRHVYRRYRELRSVRLLKAELDQEGVVSKVRHGSGGMPYGGQPLGRGALYVMLANRVYRGEIVHQGEAYRGDHEVIVDEPLWSEVQQMLLANRVDRETGAGAHEASLLAGLAFDAAGERLTPTHAVKKGTRYRYYVSQGLTTGGSKHDGKGQRIPAANLEGLVTSRIRTLIGDPAAMLTAMHDLVADAADQSRLIKLAGDYGARWSELERGQVRALLLAVVPRIQVHADRIDVSIDIAGLVSWLSDAQGGRKQERSRETGSAMTMLTIPACLKRTGIEMRFVVDGATDEGGVDASLTRVMVRAHAIRNRLLKDPGLSVDEIAREQELGPSYVTRLLRLTFLAPDIVSRILSGRHPPELTARKLMADTRLPMDWNEQRVVLGFA